MTIPGRLRPTALAAVARAAVALSAACAGTAVASSRPHRFEKAIRAFEAADRLKAPPEGGVLFAGDSSVRIWQTLEKDMPGMKVVNRGFDGATVADVVWFFDRIVSPYKPAYVVLYCGENDVAAGRRAEQVLAHFEEFAGRVQRELPETRVLYVSMKPSPRRWSLWPEFVRGNELVRGFCGGTKGFAYVDVGGAMLAADGKPRRDIWLRDRLHMNARGYAVWSDVIRTALLQQKSRWAGAMARFAARDAKVAGRKNLTVFTGSSSIAVWGGRLLKDMEGIPCINRGFGGSQISDVLLFFDKIVTPHDVKAVVLYCGENDITSGKKPERVFDDFKEFVARVREAKPGAPVFYISMKPSPSRWKRWPVFVRGNRMIEDYCAREAGLFYVDVGEAMLGDDGMPLPEIWRGDRLHMNDKGYRIWTRIVRAALQKHAP